MKRITWEDCMNWADRMQEFKTCPRTRPEAGRGRGPRLPGEGDA